MSNGIYNYVDDVKERLAEKDKRIAELEEKLEEVEGQYAYECECNKQFVECQNENEKLKQQLAEKDAEIRVAYSFRKQKCDNLQKALAEKEKFLHNRDKWIAELERQLNTSRAMERVALKGCKELEEKLKAEKEKIIKDIENKNYYGIMNKDTKKLKNTAGLDVDVFDDVIISSDLEKIKQHIHIDYLFNCVPVKIVLEELC